MAFRSWMERTGASEGSWVSEYARVASVEWRREKALVRNVRNFTYRTRDDCIPAYYDAVYDPAELTSVDLVVSRWASEAIAHVFLSFGFQNGRYLSISIETRRRQGQVYSPWGGFMRNYSLIYVLADERDLIGVRTDVRKERVCLYPLQVPQPIMRDVFRNYLERAEHLNKSPEYYNTIFNNCTTNILHHARAVHPKISYNWKIFLSGYADRYVYDLGLMNTMTNESFGQLKDRCIIQRTEKDSIDKTYSQEIREKRSELR